jgi:hypothetical protein
MTTVDIFNRCVICKWRAEDVKHRMSDDRAAQIVECPRCGTYEAVNEIISVGHSWVSEVANPLSCAARQASEDNRPLRITFENAKALAMPHSESRVVDNQERLLREVAKRSGRPQKTCVLLPGSDFTLIDCYNNNEFKWYIDSLTALGLLERPEEGSTWAHNLKLTPEGWKRIQPVTQIGGVPGQCFVAMWFADETRSAYDEGIEPAVRAAGFKAIRIDRKEHNNEITDEIIAEIRDSQFVGLVSITRPDSPWDSAAQLSGAAARTR